MFVGNRHTPFRRHSCPATSIRTDRQVGHPMMMGAPPKIFISYSHDTVEHQERVLDFAIGSELTVSTPSRPVQRRAAEGWPLWCERQITAADVVLMACTEPYHRRVSDEERGKGVGVVKTVLRVGVSRYETDASAPAVYFVCTR